MDAAYMNLEQSLTSLRATSDKLYALSQTPIGKEITLLCKDRVYVSSPENQRLRESVESFCLLLRQHNEYAYQDARNFYGKEVTDKRLPAAFMKRKRREEAAALQVQVSAGASTTILTYAQVVSGYAPEHSELERIETPQVASAACTTALTYAQVVSQSHR